MPMERQRKQLPRDAGLSSWKNFEEEKELDCSKKKVKEIKRTGVHIDSLSGDRWLLYKLETRSPFSLERKHSACVCVCGGGWRSELRACLY